MIINSTVLGLTTESLSSLLVVLKHITPQAGCKTVMRLTCAVNGRKKEREILLDNQKRAFPSHLAHKTARFVPKMVIHEKLFPVCDNVTTVKLLKEWKERKN